MGNRVNHARGENSTRWRGQEVGYSGIHMWVARVFKRPPYCEVCGNSDATRHEWANISGQYLRIRYDWMNMCIGCHRKFDAKTHCVHGHEFTPANTYVRIDGTGRRICKTCGNARSREYKRRIKNG